MPILSNIAKASDAIIGTIMSFLDKKDICKSDVAWLMYFLSKFIENDSTDNNSTDDNSYQNEKVFLSGVLTTYKKGEDIADTKMVLPNIKDIYSYKIKKLGKLFSVVSFNEKFVLNEEYSIGCSFIAETIEVLEELRRKSSELFEDKLLDNEESAYIKNLSEGMGIPNIYVFVIIFLVALRNCNDISVRDRTGIFIRLNSVFDSTFIDYIFSEYKIMQEPLFLNGYFNQKKLKFEIEQGCKSTIDNNINNIVLSVVKFIFDENFNNKVEGDLYKIASEMYHYSLHFKAILQQLRKENKGILKSNIHLSNTDLKYAVSYWLIGNEATASITGDALWNKNENFYYWIKIISEPYVESYFIN